jgi:hypothetical protein
MMTSEELERIERIQFKGLRLGTLTHGERSGKIRSRMRSRMLMLAFNVLMIVLFTYSSQSGLSRLDGGWSIAVFVVFSVNTGLYLYQITQLRRLSAYFEDER